MIKNFSQPWKLVLTVLLFSAVLIILAAYVETLVQGPLNVPGDIDFMAYIPGRYCLYRESTDTSNGDNALNEMLQCSIHGCGHLDSLIPLAWYAGGMPYQLKDPQSGKYLNGIPFADFDILWPGLYHLHVEFSGVVDKHPNVTVGPKGVVIIAVIISIMTQFIVLAVLISQSDIFRKEKASFNKRLFLSWKGSGGIIDRHPVRQSY